MTETNWDGYVFGIDPAADEALLEKAQQYEWLQTMKESTAVFEEILAGMRKHPLPR